MEYSQVILEMLERIKTLEDRVNALEQRVGDERPAPAVNGKVSAKYRALAEYLLAAREDKVTLSYAQIEAILGRDLPSSAYNFKQSFWANTDTHSQSSAWMALGYKARVDVQQETVTFVRDLVLGR